MEFLMTYGWAILVVLVAIAALAYFGVLNPARFLPSSCTIAPGISCDDHKIEAAQITLVMTNGMGDDITSVAINASTCSTSLASWTDGTQNTFTLTGCTNGASGARFKGDVGVTYTSSSGLSHTKTGQITTKVE